MKKFPVAVAITALVVAGCIAYSLFAGPVAAPQVKPGSWIYDAADALSDSAENEIRTYNQSFDAAYGSIIAVAAVPSTRGWEMEEYAMKAAETWELGPNDLILLLDTGGQDAYFLEGGNWPNLSCSDMLDQAVADDFFAGDYDAAVLSLFAAMDQWYASNAAPAGSGAQGGYDGGYYEDGYSYDYGYSSAGNGFVSLVLILLVVYILLSSIERSRYDTWRRRYGGVPHPTVMFVPIFPWHRPGSAWFLRMGRRPPRGPGGPHDPFGPGGFGGPRPGGGSRPHGGPRPGGGNPFGGGRGGGFGGGRGGGFGGGFGGGRGGGFGGGGFGGGRGGGFGGGGRGGGFGR